MPVAALYETLPITVAAGATPLLSLRHAHRWLSSGADSVAEIPRAVDHVHAL